jgi:alpha-tubulin suppressor-like RCC1 family protein
LILLVVLMLSALPASAAAEGNAALGWGENNFLELGAGFKSNMEENPLASLAGVHNIASVVSGDSFNLALLSDHTLDSWGGNIYGQLGDNSKENIWEKQTDSTLFAPAGLSHSQVVTVNKATGETTPITEVMAASASGSHSYALLKNETVDAWGNNEYGQDGKGKRNPNVRINPKTKEEETTMAGTSPATPEPVEWEVGGEPHKLANVVAIATGASSGADFAVVRDPVTGVTSLWAWGRNTSGQLGLGSAGEAGGPEECKSAELGPINCSTRPRPVELPTSVTSGERRIVAVGAGDEFAVALLDDGTALAWGNNGLGQLGANTGKENHVNHPVPVEGLTEAATIATGGNSTLALLKNGAVQGWGANGNGQLGEESGQLGEVGTEECQKTPCRRHASPISWTDAEGSHMLTGVSAVTAGYGYSLVLREGKLSSFGTSAFGTLGLGSSRTAETCRNEKEIREKNGKVVNRLDNNARCAGPEECVNVAEPTVNWRGQWSEGVEYGYGDGAEEGGLKYVSIQEHNRKHRPSQSPTWWVQVSESTGDKAREELGNACARTPHQIEGLGAVSSVTAGAKHVIAVLQSSSSAPPPIVTLTPQQESLTVKWREPAEKAEYRVRAGRFDPLQPGAPEYGKTWTYKVEPPGEREEARTFPGEGEEGPFKIEPYVVMLRTCRPECEIGVNPEKVRLIGGTPLPPPPRVSAVAPAQGPTGGGTSVTITGTNLGGATAVNFGAVPAKTFNVSSPTTITAVAPEEAAGTVDVTVSTRGGTSGTGAADQFTYVAPPNVTSVEPNSGPVAGGTPVTITGANLSGASSVKFGSVAATSFEVRSASTISAVAPEGTAGTVDVTVSTIGGTSVTGSADHYTYAPAPAVTSVEPNAGPAAGGTSVTITGTNLSGASAVRFGSIAATSFEVSSPTTIVAVAPAEAAGNVDVTVTSAGGTSRTSPADAYTYASLPTITKLEPSAGPTAGGNSVTIIGTNLAAARAVSFGLTGATITSDSESAITVTAPAGLMGTVDVTVTTPGGTSAMSASDQYTYTLPPTVTKVKPTTGFTGGGTAVTVTGTNLSGTSAVRFGGANASSFKVLSSTSLTAVSPAEAAGPVDVTVTTAGGTSASSTADRFSFEPAISSVSPNTGPTTGGTSLTISGEGFATGTAGTKFKFGTTSAGSVNCPSSTECTVVTPAEPAGVVDVRATVNKEVSPKTAADTFTYS